MPEKTFPKTGRGEAWVGIGVPDVPDPFHLGHIWDRHLGHPSFRVYILITRGDILLSSLLLWGVPDVPDVLGFFLVVEKKLKKEN